MATYTYKTLPEHGSIRLLHIEPGVDDAEIICTISHVQLSSKPVFEALSYTWGTSNKSETITCSCSGETLSVTKNLLLALRRFRYPDRNRALWIDAVCINQEDEVEKCYQVRQMQDIYKKADLVLIWLGEAVESDKEAFGILQDISKKLMTIMPGIEFISENFTSVYQQRISSAFPMAQSSYWAALLNLLRRPWFQRVWIVQEVVFARRAIVFCGPHQINWSSMSEAVNAMRSAGRFDYSVRGGKTMWVVLRVQSGACPMYDLLSQTRTFQATNPRDRVFALMGLAVDSNDLGVEIDYSLDPSSMYRKMAVHALLVKQNMRYLSSAGHSKPTPGDAPLPSWVTDWRVIEDYRTNLGLQSASTSKWKTSGAIRPKLSLDGDILTIHGCAFDRISRVGKISPITKVGEDGVPLQKENMKMKAEWFLEFKDIASSSNPYPSGENYFQVLWRVVVGGTNSTGHRAPPGFAASYLAMKMECDNWPEVQELSNKIDRGEAVGASVSKLVRLSSKLSRDLGKFSQDEDFGVALGLVATGRVFCCTDNKYLGLVPSHSKPGDMVCILFGADVPFVLRPHPTQEDYYQLIGECYLHGIMDGEATKKTYLDSKDFNLH